jgi:hypothetical protein
MALPSSLANRAGACRAALAAALLTWGCGHTEPFSSPPTGSDAPFDPSPPVRLTFNLGVDRRPWWLPDGSALLYSTQELGRGDKDVCLGLLPATGGTRQRLWCTGPSEGRDLDAIESAAISPGGLLAFVSATGRDGPSPARQDIAVAPSLDPATAQRVRQLPNLPYGAATQTSAEHLRWLDEVRLIYVDQAFHVRRPCAACEVDTLRVGKSLAILNVNPAGSEPFPLPGTEQATGVALAPGGEAILWTRGGDSRVFRRSLISGVEDVLYDFGALQFVRDIHVAGNRMAAIVGGHVAFGVDPDLGLMQFDSGGSVHVVDLNSGADLTLNSIIDGRAYRRPVLSPSGDHVAVEGYPVIELSETTSVVGRNSDLYLFGAR